MTQEEKQFYSEFFEIVTEQSNENETSVETELTKSIIDYVIENGEALAPEICECQSNPANEKLTGRYKLNAFDYSESTGILDLFGTVYYEGKDPSLSQGAAERTVNELSCFLRLSIEGQESKRAYGDDSDVRDVMDMIKEEYDSKHIELIRIFVLSNGFKAVELDDWEDGEFRKNSTSNYIIPIEYHFWDMEEVFKAEQARHNNQEIIINLENDYQTKLECIEAFDEKNGIKSYLTIMPAIILARIYSKYKVRLIDQNVRNFLGGKIKVNSEMAKTISETPELFFSYNNGISSTAADVIVRTDEAGRKYISTIRNWHIVNGGQTTSTIYNAFKKKGMEDNLQKAYVSVKVSEVPQVVGQNIKNLVSDIAKYANSQTKIKDSDLSANAPYMLDLEYQSRNEQATDANGRTSFWYFERLRGQFLTEKSMAGGVGTQKQKRFEEERPQSQRFSKSDVAKWEMAWNEKPYDACKGAEVCFDKYWKIIKDNTPKVDEQYFHSIVAKSIIYKRVNSILIARGNKGHAAIIASYTLALLSLRSQKKLNLDYIWQNQNVHNDLIPVIEECIKAVSEQLRIMATQDKNPQTESKKVDFWNNIQNRTLNITLPDSVLIDESNMIVITEEQRKALEAALGRGADFWLNLSAWCRKDGRGRMSIMEKKKVDHLAMAIERGTDVKAKLAEDCERTLRLAKDAGFDPMRTY
jgi:hypothetical protein